MGRQGLGLDGPRLIDQEWLVRPYEGGKDGLIPAQHREGVTSGYRFAEDRLEKTDITSAQRSTRTTPIHS